MGKFTPTNGVVPLGTILAVSYDSVPPGWLECNGAAISQSTYADLFIALGYRFGNPGGGQFRLPDLRGRFIRGWAHGSTEDADRAARVAQASGGITGDNVGSYQNYDLHFHRTIRYGGAGDDEAYNVSANLFDLSEDYTPTGKAAPVVGAIGADETSDANSRYSSRPFKVGTNTEMETRPKNIYAMYIIKY